MLDPHSLTPPAAPFATVGELLALLARAARLSESSEPLDQLAHGLQCAHELRRAAPDDVELQVAGLVHDVGHLLAPGDDAGHGRIGGDAVRPLLGDRVARLVELHVPAKRFLVSTEPAYRHGLSADSTVTLARQGGDMDQRAIAAFETLPGWRDAVRLRRADEAAKAAGRVVPGLDAWRPALESVAAARSAP